MTVNNNQKGVALFILLITIAFLIIVAFSSIRFLFKKPSISIKENSNNLPTEAILVTPEMTPAEPDKLESEQILEDIAGKGITCDTKNYTPYVFNGNCKVEKIVGNYAKGLAPMEYWIAVKNEGGWQVVITGNGIPKCAEIDKYTVPQEIYGNCIEASGELRNQQ